jgi:hypothetical protein
LRLWNGGNTEQALKIIQTVMRFKNQITFDGGALENPPKPDIQKAPKFNLSAVRTPHVEKSRHDIM